MSNLLHIKVLIRFRKLPFMFPIFYLYQIVKKEVQNHEYYIR